jgi:hypothetical protein
MATLSSSAVIVPNDNVTLIADKVRSQRDASSARRGMSMGGKVTSAMLALVSTLA